MMTDNSFVVLICPHFPFVFLGASETKYDYLLLHSMLICLDYISTEYIIISAVLKK